MDHLKSAAIAESIKLDAEEFSWKKPLIKALLLMMVLMAGLLIIATTPLKQYLSQYREIARQLAMMGSAAPLLFIVGVACLVFIGVPRLILCFLGGMTFGFFWGLVLTQIGTIIGFYAAFLFVRWGGRDLAIRIWPRLRNLEHRFKQYSFPAVILIRQLPFNGMFINLLLGMLPISHTNYLLGTMIGILPEAIPCTLIGSGAIQQSMGKSFGLTATSLVLLLGVWIFCGLYVKAKRSQVIMPETSENLVQEQ
jgi:uncharacterized membrane protein YdjX (TVP38/TMEM64 family)